MPSETLPQEIKNAKQMPKFYYARHMEPGLCGYGDEKWLVEMDAMKRMSPTMEGKQIFVDHRDEPGKFIRGMTTELPDDQDGYVVENFFNPLDGWLWAKMLITTDKGHAAVKDGWSVSNGYLPRSFYSGDGEHHAIDYDKKLRDGEFTHLALVKNPRYENAKIYTEDGFQAYQAQKRQELAELQNNKGNASMFKGFFKKSKEAVTKPEEINEETILVGKDGKERPLGELWNAADAKDADEAKKAKEADEKKNAESDEEKKKKDEEKKNWADMDVDVNGATMKGSELVNKYCAMNDRVNALEADEKKRKDDDEKKNAAAKDAEEKKNSKTKNFDALKEADKTRNSANAAPQVSLSMVDRGKQNYGSGT